MQYIAFKVDYKLEKQMSKSGLFSGVLLIPWLVILIVQYL